jgi:hypothetical protein
MSQQDKATMTRPSALELTKNALKQYCQHYLGGALNFNSIPDGPGTKNDKVESITAAILNASEAYLANSGIARTYADESDNAKLRITTAKSSTHLGLETAWYVDEARSLESYLPGKVEIKLGLDDHGQYTVSRMTWVDDPQDIDDSSDESDQE